MTAAAQLLPTGWESWAPEHKQRLLDGLKAADAQRRRRRWQPYPWQRPHLHPEDRPPGPCDPSCLKLPAAVVPYLGYFLQVGGRGTGKTDGAAHYVLNHLDGPPCDPRQPGGHRIAIVAPTLGDAVESCVTGASGLQAYDPRVQHFTSTGGTYVRFPGGAKGKVFGAHTPNDVERLRAGGNRCLVWLEEAAAMRQLAGVLEHSAFGLRVGPRAHYVVSTTPKALPAVRELMADSTAIRTWGTTDQATHLPQAFRERIEAKHGNTRAGRQELGGELLDDVEGALWKLAMIDGHRVIPPGGRGDDAGLIGADPMPPLGKIIVAIDPNAGGPDEAGIVVVGRSAEKLPDRGGRLAWHGYVLEDCSDHFDSSTGWAKAGVAAYHRWSADAIVAETNNGGDMVGLTVRTVDPDVRYRSVTATRGKAVRAEPVVGLYEQHRMHHAGTFPKLEDQQTTWTDEAGYSPDRMDALVWGATDLLLNERRGFASVS